MIASQKPGDNSLCDVTYRTLCFYHQFADGPVYTLNTDDRLVESRFASVFHPSSVKLDASFARIPLLQINHFSTHSFADKNSFLSSSINIKSLT